MTRIWWFPSLPLVESEVPKSDVIVPSGKRRPFKWQTSQHLSADVCPNTKKECDNDNSVSVSYKCPFANASSQIRIGFLKQYFL